MSDCIAAAMVTKVCARCGIEKSLDSFSRGSSHRKLTKNWCKECMRAPKASRYNKAPPVTVDGVVHKLCSVCNHYKPLDQFPIHNGCLLGRAHQCYACRKVQNSKRFRDRYREDEAFRSRSRANTSAWVSKNKDRLKKAYKEAARRQILQNPLRKQWRVMNRSSEKRGLNPIPWEQYLAVMEKADGVCMYCGNAQHMLSMDHVIPVSKGGTNDVGNLVACCMGCNSVKGAHSLEYLQWRLDNTWFLRFPEMRARSVFRDKAIMADPPE